MPITDDEMIEKLQERAESRVPTVVKNMIETNDVAGLIDYLKTGQPYSYEIPKYDYSSTCYSAETGQQEPRMDGTESTTRYVSAIHALRDHPELATKAATFLKDNISALLQSVHDKNFDRMGHALIGKKVPEGIEKLRAFSATLSKSDPDKQTFHCLDTVLAISAFVNEKANEAKIGRNSKVKDLYSNLQANMNTVNAESRHTPRM